MCFNKEYSFTYSLIGLLIIRIMQNNPDKFHVVQRPRKHRYLYIIANKKDKKQILKNFKYPILDYPKFKNKNYKTNTNIETQGVLF